MRRSLAIAAVLAASVGCRPASPPVPGPAPGRHPAPDASTSDGTADSVPVSSEPAPGGGAPPSHTRLAVLGEDCAVDDDCAADAPMCVTNGPVTRCTRACGPGAPCPPSYYCAVARVIRDEKMEKTRVCIKPVVRPRPPEPPNDPTRRPADNVAGCDADASHCCGPGGEIVYAGCCGGALPPVCAGTGPDRGPGGLCESCTRRCLPASSRIATPSGAVPIARLREGDLVWTADTTGARVAARIASVRPWPLAGPHELAVVNLADGREIAASPDHPAADGRDVGALVPGDVLDGARVTAVRRVPYHGEATWDLRPAGPTGIYWADGVPLGTTLP